MCLLCYSTSQSNKVRLHKLSCITNVHLLNRVMWISSQIHNNTQPARLFTAKIPVFRVNVQRCARPVLLTGMKSVPRKSDRARSRIPV